MDLVFLQWLTSLTAAICVVTILILRKMDPQEPSLRLWTAAALLLSSGNLFGALREVLPNIPAIIIGNVLSVMGAAMIVQALRVLIGLPRGPKLHWPLGALFLVSSTWFSAFYPSAGARLFMGSVLGAAVFLYDSKLLWSWREPGLDHLPRIASVVFAITGLGYAIRALLVPLVHTPSDYLTTSNWTVVVLYGLSILEWTTLAVTLSFVISTRVHRRLQAALDAADEANLRLLEMTWLDPATQAANRGRIAGLLASGVQTNVSFGIPFAALLVSVEGAQRDSLDPRTVDVSMSDVAEVLRTTMNLAEPDFETLGRWGDDAFLVLLSGFTQGQSVELAQRLASALDAHRGGSSWNGYHIGVTMARPTDSVEDLLDRLYEATYSSESAQVQFR